MADKYNCPSCGKEVGKIGLCPSCAKIDYASKPKPIEKPKKKAKKKQ